MENQLHRKTVKLIQEAKRKLEKGTLTNREYADLLQKIHYELEGDVKYGEDVPSGYETPVSLASEEQSVTEEQVLETTYNQINLEKYVDLSQFPEKYLLELRVKLRTDTREEAKELSKRITDEINARILKEKYDITNDQNLSR